MNRVADYLFAIAVTLWVGVLWALGLVAAPVLFRELSDRALAGNLAGAMFAVMAWIGIGAATYALLFLFAREGARAIKSAAFWLILVMLLLTLAGHFGVTPILAHLKAEALPREVMESVLRNRFMAWHGVSSVLYLIQCVLGVALVTQLFKR
jgi:membrane protease YdiL (CAAX protease family)